MSLPAMIAAGMGVGAGLACLLAALSPSRPDLAAALRTAADPDAGPLPVPPAPFDRPLRLLDRDRVAALARLPARDLALIGRSPAEHGLRKLVCAGAGCLLPAAAAALLAPAGIGVPAVATIGLAAAAGIVGFFLPDAQARGKAEHARTYLRHAVLSYLVLVALERRAGSASQQALVQAAQVAEADNWVFARIRAALDRARLQRRPAWEGLRDLAAETDVPELRDCADIMATSADGGAVADTLLARAHALRSEALNRKRAQANEASERMVVPVAALGLCFIALLMYPVAVRLLML